MICTSNGAVSVDAGLPTGWNIVIANTSMNEIIVSLDSSERTLETNENTFIIPAKYSVQATKISSTLG